ncbi:MAG: hypothetical protein ACE5I9_07165 [Candidatus Methylomirabilales bacterium]
MIFITTSTLITLLIPALQASVRSVEDQGSRGHVNQLRTYQFGFLVAAVILARIGLWLARSLNAPVDKVSQNIGAVP